jgi:hypothetical protein
MNRRVSILLALAIAGGAGFATGSVWNLMDARQPSHVERLAGLFHSSAVAGTNQPNGLDASSGDLTPDVTSVQSLDLQQRQLDPAGAASLGENGIGQQQAEGRMGVKGGPASVISAVVNRGETRIIECKRPPGRSSGFSGITAEQEIDVTAVTVHTGYFATGEGTKGGWGLGINGAYQAFAFDGYGTQHYTFPIPLRLRQGDLIEFLIREGSPTAPYCSMVLHGMRPRPEGVILR